LLWSVCIPLLVHPPYLFPPKESIPLSVMRPVRASDEFGWNGQYLTRGDVARLMGVTPNTVTRWAREGRIPSQMTLGGHHRFERAVIEQMRQDLCQGAKVFTFVGKADPR